jgi:type IV fimbrial biogenesis protein FimT
MAISRSTALAPNRHRTNGDAMRRHAGFSLVELLVVLTIVSILLVVGVPSFKSLIATQRIKSAASNLQVYLNLTRAEALKRNANVTLSPNQSGDWSTGWNIVDPSTGTILYTTPSVSQITITGGPTSVIYRGTGRLNGTTDVVFKLNSTSTTNCRRVEVDLSGIAMVTSTGC